MNEKKSDYAQRMENARKGAAEGSRKASAKVVKNSYNPDDAIKRLRTIMKEHSGRDREV
jgi:hypothetical protein